MEYSPLSANGAFSTRPTMLTEMWLRCMSLGRIRAKCRFVRRVDFLITTACDTSWALPWSELMTVDEVMAYLRSRAKESTALIYQRHGAKDPLGVSFAELEKL